MSDEAEIAGRLPTIRQYDRVRVVGSVKRPHLNGLEGRVTRINRGGGHRNSYRVELPGGYHNFARPYLELIKIEHPNAE